MSSKLKYDTILGQLRQEDVATVSNVEGLQSALDNKETKFLVVNRQADETTIYSKIQNINPTYIFIANSSLLTLDEITEKTIKNITLNIYNNPVKGSNKFSKGELTYSIKTTLKVWIDEENKVWQEIVNPVEEVTYKRHSGIINEALAWTEWFDVKNVDIQEIAEQTELNTTNLSDLTQRKRTYTIGVDVYKGEVKTNKEMLERILSVETGYDIDDCIKDYWNLSDLKNIPCKYQNDNFNTYPDIYDIEMRYYAEGLEDYKEQNDIYTNITLAKGVLLNYCRGYGIFKKNIQYLILFCFENNEGKCTINYNIESTNINIRIYKKEKLNGITNFERITDPFEIESIKTRLTQLENNSNSNSTPIFNTEDIDEGQNILVSYDNGNNWETLTTIYNGIQGEQGIQGDQGQSGEQGPQGERGENGKSAYEYAVEGGFDGTEEEFAQQLANAGNQNSDSNDRLVTGVSTFNYRVDYDEVIQTLIPNTGGTIYAAIQNADRFPSLLITLMNHDSQTIAINENIIIIVENQEADFPIFIGKATLSDDFIYDSSTQKFYLRLLLEIPTAKPQMSSLWEKHIEFEISETEILTQGTQEELEQLFSQKSWTDFQPIV